MAAQTELTAALRLSVMRLARRLRSERATTGLTLTQLAALATLDRHGPLTPGELAAHEKVRPPSMTKVVAALAAEGLLTRTPHPTDGRQVLLAPSPAASAMLREDRARRDAWLAEQLRSLSEADLAALQRAVAVLDDLAGR